MSLVSSVRDFYDESHRYKELDGRILRESDTNAKTGVTSMVTRCGGGWFSKILLFIITTVEKVDGSGG